MPQRREHLARVARHPVRGHAHRAQRVVVRPDRPVMVAERVVGGLARSERADPPRSEEHTSELHHVKISYAVFCLKKKKIEHFRTRYRLDSISKNDEYDGSPRRFAAATWRGSHLHHAVLLLATV